MNFNKYGEALGFQKKENLWVMESNGFTVYLKNWQYITLTISSFYIPLNMELDKDELKKMEAASFDNAVAAQSTGNKNDTLIVTLADGRKSNPKTQEIIRKQIDSCTKVLTEDGYGPMTICPICQKAAEYGEFGEDFVPIHKECLEAHIEKLKSQIVEEKGFNPRYLLAILFSIIGAAIGLIPALLFGLYKFNYFAGLLALVPILATLGYYLAKAPNKKWVKYITGGIVFVTILEFLIFMIPYMAVHQDQTILEFIFKGKWVGFRKILLGSILAFGGFGGTKFLDKFKKNPNQELDKFIKK